MDANQIVGIIFLFTLLIVGIGLMVVAKKIKRSDKEKKDQKWYGSE